MNTTFTTTRMTKLRFVGTMVVVVTVTTIVFSIMKEGRVDVPILLGCIIGSTVAGFSPFSPKFDIVIGEDFVEGPVRGRLFIIGKKRFPMPSIDLASSRRRSFGRHAFLMTTTGEKMMLYSHLTSDQVHRIFAMIEERQSQQRVAN